MFRIPWGCAVFLCAGKVLVGFIFLLGLNRNGEDLRMGGLFLIAVFGLSLWALLSGR